MCNIWRTSNTLNLHFVSPLVKQNEKKNVSSKHKSAAVGETISFSVCNKPFKPLGIPSGQVKSREGLPAMTHTNICQHYVIDKNEFSHKQMVLTHEHG